MTQRDNDNQGAAAERCTPIFVIGHYRSGTTWVANLLAAHPDVYTPTHPEHYGQVESNFFSSLLPYCSWGRTEADRIAMRAIFECSDYWHILFPADPPSIAASARQPDAYFRDCMDEAAKRRGCSCWVEKTPTHTLLLGYLVRQFPDALFVAVHRARHDVIRSYMFNSTDPYSAWHWVTRAMMVEVYGKIISRYSASVIHVNYEDLVQNPDGTVRSLYENLNLRIAGDAKSSWTANSSFKGPAAHVPMHLVALATFVSWVFRFVPSAWCERIGMRGFRDGGHESLPSFFFRVFEGRYGGRGCQTLQDGKVPAGVSSAESRNTP